MVCSVTHRRCATAHLCRQQSMSENWFASKCTGFRVSACCCLHTMCRLIQGLASRPRSSSLPQPAPLTGSRRSDVGLVHGQAARPSIIICLQPPQRNVKQSQKHIDPSWAKQGLTGICVPLHSFIYSSTKPGIAVRKVMPCRRAEAHKGIVVDVLPVQLLVVGEADTHKALLEAQVARVDGLACRMHQSELRGVNETL